VLCTWTAPSTSVSTTQYELLRKSIFLVPPPECVMSWSPMPHSSQEDVTASMAKSSPVKSFGHYHYRVEFEYAWQAMHKVNYAWAQARAGQKPEVVPWRLLPFQLYLFLEFKGQNSPSSTCTYAKDQSLSIYSTRTHATLRSSHTRRTDKPTHKHNLPPHSETLSMTTILHKQFMVA
jgi:hypothetical protein